MRIKPSFGVGVLRLRILAKRTVGFGISGPGVTPPGNFFKSFCPGLLEEPDAVAGMLEFVDVRPHLGLPAVVVDGAGPASGAPGMQFPRRIARTGWLRLQFDENAAYLFNIFVVSNYVFVTQEIAEAKLAGLVLGLRPGVKRSIFGPELFG